ncbi:MAG: nitroreductase family protein [Treponema sp.]|jgi:nitroreductase|nr:nitroreductase family protein [Treponema sp.]
MSAIFERRSVRSFLPKPVEPEKIDRILRAAFEAPSAHNRRPWEFIVITSGEDLKDIAAMSPYAKMLPKAAAAIAPCANLKLLGEKAAPDDTWWVQDLSAATENMLLQITEEGLGGVWLGWYPDESRVRAFSAKFGLPAHIIPFSVVALGYPAAPVKPAVRFDPSLVHYGAYGKK